MDADQIMWSVDYPSGNTLWAADWVDAFPINANDKRKMCYHRQKMYRKPGRNHMTPKIAPSQFCTLGEMRSNMQD
jgi:hypothetical protein